MSNNLKHKLKLNVGIVGVTGAVGEVLLQVFKERNFPIEKLRGYASLLSEGKTIDFRNANREKPKCEVLKKGCFSGLDFVFFDASDAISSEWVAEAVEAGAIVIDNSSVYRMKEEVSLVVPEVNGDRIESDLSLLKKIFSGPNCTTAQLVLPLKAIDEKFGLKRVVVSTYQAVSGAGLLALQELREQTRGHLNGNERKAAILPHPIMFNCIPQIGKFVENGYTSEEMKVIEETKKILSLPRLKITCTAVRVPVQHGHSESVSIECNRSFEMEEVVKCLSEFPGIQVMDSPASQTYPMPLSSAGKDAVFVGRIRRDFSVENGIQLWIVADNLRKGAALNAVQIAERICTSTFTNV